ncbi:titin homolog isoform X2 [Euwallacea fornicatus]
MPEPPSQIFEWEDNDPSGRLQPASYVDMANQRQRVDMGHSNAFSGTLGTLMSIGAPMNTPVSLAPIPPSIEPKAPIIPIRENRPAPTTANTFPMVPLVPTCYEIGHCNSILVPITKNVTAVNETNTNCEPGSISSFQDLELPDFITGDAHQLNPSPTKRGSTFNPDCMLISGCRRQSECSDILNTSFTSTDFANFDMDQYIFDEPKQSKQSSIYTQSQANSLTLINSKTEIISEGCNSTVKPVARKLYCKGRSRASGKKLDHVTQQYIVADTKKTCSDDEDDVDIETVSEEEPGPILQAGNITDLLEQFEATEMNSMLQEKMETVEEKYLKAPNKTEKVEDHVATKSKHKSRKRKNGALKTNKPEKDNTKMITPEKDVVKFVKPDKDNVKSPKNAEKNYPQRAKIETIDVKPNASVKQEQLLKKNIMGTVKSTTQQEQLVKKNIGSAVKPPAKAEEVFYKNIVDIVKLPTAQQVQFAQKNIVSTIKPAAKQEKLGKKNNASAVKCKTQQEKLIKKNSASTVKATAKQEQLLKKTTGGTARLPTKSETILNKNTANTVKLPTAQQVQVPQKSIVSAIKPTTKEQKLINKNTVSTATPKPIQGATTSLKPSVLTESSHFMNCYPTELINRIKESGKRKTITVIDPIPHNHIKRRKVHDSCNKVVVKTVSPINRHTVQLDHNYCTKKITDNNNVGIAKAPVSNKKDPVFTVSSDEDKKKVINGQPMKKNADGTLMVSLLKSNTISQLETPLNKRKTLNLDEYKKRRNPSEVTKNSYEKSSPSISISTSCQPQLQAETEYQRMLQHQEKLRKMAQEVLKAAPKAERDQNTNENMLPSTSGKSGSVRRAGELKNKTEIQTKAMIEHPRAVVRPPRVPPNLERKIYVNIGVNTDFRIPRDQDPLAPLETLQELKPLLEQSSHRINDQSLISSMIQHVPKVVQQRETALSRVSTEASYNNGEHGECKQVVYLEKNRVRRPTKSTTTQTNISLISQRSNVRKQSIATSSRHTSPGTSYRNGRHSRPARGSYSSSRGSETSPGSTSISPASSVHSSVGWSRLSCHSRSRSRTRSPPYSRKRRYSSSSYREYLNAVEERRIIYVGKVPRGTTKEDLYRKFRKFGPINKVTLHFRDMGENYGFLNFTFKEDAHEAFARGNEDPTYPSYKICFGGRREFCKAAYSDLDYANDDPYNQSSASNDSYDDMLQDMLDIVHLREA